MDDATARDLVWAGATEFQRLIARKAKGARLYERDGVVASVVPDVASSFINAAVLRAHADHQGAIARVAEPTRRQASRSGACGPTPPIATPPKHSQAPA